MISSKMACGDVQRLCQFCVVASENAEHIIDIAPKRLKVLHCLFVSGIDTSTEQTLDDDKDVERLRMVFFIVKHRFWNRGYLPSDYIRHEMRACVANQAYRFYPAQEALLVDAEGFSNFIRYNR